MFGAKAFVRIPDSMRRKMDPKAKRTIFVGYDRFTDKIYRVYDPEKKTVERVADVIIEDVTDTTDQVLFPLSSEEPEEVFEESTTEESSVEDSTDESFTDATEDVILFSSEPESEPEPEIQRKRGRPLGSKSYQKPIPPTDRVLRDRSNKSAHIAAMKVSLDPVSYEDATSRIDSALWKKAMDDEMSSLLKNRTWELESLLEGQPVVSC